MTDTKETGGTPAGTEGQVDPATAAGGETGGGGGDGDSPPADWRAGLPPALAQHAALAEIADVKGLASAYVGEREKQNGNAVALPGDPEDQAGWDRVWTALGRPATAAEYDLGDFTPPEDLGWNPAVQEKMMERMHAAGLTSKQARAVISDYAELVIADLHETLAGADVGFERATAELKAVWGTNFSAEMAKANRVVAHFLGDDAGRLKTTALADGTFLMDNPLLARAFAAIGDQLGEDLLNPAAGGTPATMTVEGAKAEIERLAADDKFQAIYMDQAHPQYKSAVEQWDSLHKIAYPV